MYERIVKMFPLNIKAIYIRQTTKRQKNKVQEVLDNIEDLGVGTCYFKDSGKAIGHSKKIGII